jgi:hypothetical protein
MERHDFKKGDWVFVINQRLNRSYFVEGKAQVVKPDLRNENCYLVRMKEREGWETYSRYVDPAAQKNAENYAFQLNERVRARA